MRQSDARTMAVDLMIEHGVWATGWRFGWNRRKVALGLCEYGQRRISLSTFHVEANDEATIRNTILHEIAHAKAGNRAGHGPVWRSIFIAIGGNGERCSDSEAQLDHAWVGVCRNGHETRQHRAPLRVKSCGRCSSVFRPENVYVWRKEGRRVPLGAMPLRYAQEALRLRNRYADRLPI